MNIANMVTRLGDQSVAISDLVDRQELDKSDAIIFEKIMGLSSVRRHCNQTILSQINQLLKSMLQEHTLDCDTIKYVLFSHTADHVVPWGYHTIQNCLEHYKIKNALYFESTLHKCAGGFNLMLLSKNLFQNMHENDTILILLCDITFTRILRTIPGSTMMGDAGTAIALKKSGQSHFFVDGCITSYGQFAKGLWQTQDEKLLFQSTYVQCVAEIITDVIKRNHLLLSDIRCIFPHNVNKLSWRAVINALALSSEQVFLDNISLTGHCFGSDPFFNLQSGIVSNRIQPGDYYLLVTMGLGATFGALLFQY